MSNTSVALEGIVGQCQGHAYRGVRIDANSQICISRLK